MEHNCAHPLVFYQDLLRKAESDLRVAEDAGGRQESRERVCEGEVGCCHVEGDLRLQRERQDKAGE